MRNVESWEVGQSDAAIVRVLFLCWLSLLERERERERFDLADSSVTQIGRLLGLGGPFRLH